MGEATVCNTFSMSPGIFLKSQIRFWRYWHLAVASSLPTLPQYTPDDFVWPNLPADPPPGQTTGLNLKKNSLFRIVFERFRTVFEPFRIVFGRVPAVSDDSIPNFKNFKFQLATAGARPCRSVRPCRPPQPWPIEIWNFTKKSEKTERKRPKKNERKRKKRKVLYEKSIARRR